MRKLKEPSASDKILIRLASENNKLDTKVKTLVEMAVAHAQETNRAKPLSRQRVQQVLEKWNGIGGFIYQPGLLPQETKRNAEHYAKGGNIVGKSVNYKALKQLRIPKRGKKNTYYITVTLQNKVVRLSELWKSGKTAVQIAHELDRSPASVKVRIIQLRGKHPELFPYRYNCVARKKVVGG